MGRRDGGRERHRVAIQFRVWGLPRRAPQQRYCRFISTSDVDADKNPHSDGNEDANAMAGDFNPDENFHANDSGNGYSDKNGHADNSGDRNADENINADTADTDENGDGDSDTNCDTDSHQNSYGDADACARG
jgi:hypothetical protein